MTTPSATSIRVFQAQYQPTDRPIEDRIAVAQSRTPADDRITVGVFDGTYTYDIAI